MNNWISYRGVLFAAVLLLVNIGLTGCMLDFEICAPNGYGEGTQLYSFSVESPKESEIVAHVNHRVFSIKTVTPGVIGNDFHIVMDNRIIHYSFHTLPFVVTSHIVADARNLAISPDRLRFLHDSTKDPKYLGIVDASGDNIGSVPFLESTTRVQSAQWLNDHKVAYFAQDSTLGDGIYIADLIELSTEKVTSGKELNGFALSKDESKLVVSEMRRDEVGNRYDMLVFVDLKNGHRNDLVRGRWPEFVAGDQKILYRDDNGIALLNLDGNFTELTIKTYWAQYYNISVDRNSLILITQENSSYNVRLVKLDSGTQSIIANVSDFTIVLASHWDSITTSILRAPFFSEDGKSAYVYVERKYYNNGCPD
jgi:hypothetical protein